MFKVIEAFSGIGSQAKALKNIGIDYEIIATIDWDINAIIAYDIIHNGVPDLSSCKLLTLDEIRNQLKKYTLSSDGKLPLNPESIEKMPKTTIEHLWAAINRSKNLISITDVKGKDLPHDIDLFTYSFPCQDLSIARAWHGENGGINRGVKNRSGMLWEVERILQERSQQNLKMPKFLLMENVSNILSPKHLPNLNEWKSNLESMGYFNHIYKLDSRNFGMPQRRERVYMLSVLCNKNQENNIKNYLSQNNLNDQQYLKRMSIKNVKLDKILKVDYENIIYKNEANENQPNNTPSREKIYNENSILYDGKKVIFEYVQTITTKQDRHPNSGIIQYDSGIEGKAKYRNLTPRECFMLMGFDEEDFQKLIDNDFKTRGNMKFFSRGKLYKMAGNSIVVQVLESIFNQIIYINNNLLK